MTMLDYVGAIGLILFIVGVIGLVISEIRSIRLRRILEKCRQLEIEQWYNDASARIINGGSSNGK